MSDRFEVWCPIIKEKCVNGHNKIMGRTADDDLVKCGFWKKIVGEDKKTGQVVDQWGCISHWIPDLLIENTIQVLYGNATTDKVASEVAKHHATTIAAMSNEQKEILLSTDPRRKLLPGSNGKQGGE